MIKGLSILGSTGSIGAQALEVCRNLNIKIISLIANRNAKVMEEQIRQFKPEMAALFDEEAAESLKLSVKDTETKVLKGLDGIIEAVTNPGADTVLTSVVGIAGLIPTIAAIEAGKILPCPTKKL